MRNLDKNNDENNIFNKIFNLNCGDIHKLWTNIWNDDATVR